MNPEQLKLVRTTVSYLCSFGAGRCVGAVIETNAIPKSGFDKLLIKAGSFALGGIAAAHAKSHTEQEFDNLVEAVQKLNQALQKNNTSQ